MTLMRGFSRGSEKGAVPIPENMRREVGLKAGPPGELKVVGASKAKSLLVSQREAAREADGAASISSQEAKT